MKYKYLAAWATENSYPKAVFKRIDKYEDQYRIIFRKRNTFLQINLASEDSFCFFTDEDLLPWQEANDLSVISTHLSSARLNKIEISKMDRIIHFLFEKIDIYNQKQNYSLIVELIPRYQNIILVDSFNMIIDCKKKISFAENRHRQIIPGVEYQAPDVEYENIVEQISFPIKKEGKKIVENCSDGFQKVNDIFNHIYYREIFYLRNEKKRADAVRKVNKQIKKLSKKIQKLQVELASAEKVTEWKQKAELLKGNYNQLKPGMDKIKVLNYYEENFPEIEILLLPELSVQHNIDKYFKKYRKSRDGKIIIEKQIEKARAEIDQLERERFDLEEQEFFFKDKVGKQSKKQNKKSLKKISIDDEWEIFIGRTRIENDYLTTRLAKPDDWWFHTRIYRGTHIILRNYKRKELPETLKILCCRLAAYFSKAKKSSNIPVDYTQIRYVRKPRGSVAGYVTYKNQKTLYVDPLSMRETIKEIDKWREK